MFHPRARMPFTRQMLLLQVGVIFGLGLASLAAVSLLLDSTLKAQYEQRALTLAESVAADPALAAEVAAEDQGAVQARAMAVSRATGALFVVVTDRAGIRLAHPSPDEIGRPVSTDPSAALSGRETTSIERGTLGLSARGKVPLRDANGAIIGEVSVGFAASQIGSALRALLLIAIPVGLLAVLLGALLSAGLARRLKRLTFGLEPHEVADLVREREAVLHGIGEGIVAVDPGGQITMVNPEAQRLLSGVRAGAHLDEVGMPDRLRAAFDSDDDRVTAVSGNRVLVGTHRAVRLDGSDLGSVLTIRDRTDLEELTDELAAVRSMTSALRAQRHEFANRLHTLSGLLSTGATQDATDYLNGILDTDVNGASGLPEVVHSNTIRAFFAAKTAQAAERGVELVLADDSWLPHKLIAPVEVITVLGNVVDNAIDAAAESTHRPARVEVLLLEDERDLVISVADTGDGVEPDLLESIFVEGVSSRGPQRGLGLAISRATARGLGGDIEITANARNGGETVVVARLPYVLAQDEQEAGSA